MLGVKVRLIAVRARILAIRVLLRYQVLRTGPATLRGRVRPARCAWEDAASALGANHVRRLLFVLHERRLLSNSRTRQTGQATDGARDATWGHRPEAGQAGRGAHGRHRGCRGRRVHHRLRHGVGGVEIGRGQHGTLWVCGREAGVGVGCVLRHGRRDGRVRGGRSGRLAARVGEGQRTELCEAAILVLQRRQGRVGGRVVVLGLAGQVREGGYWRGVLGRRRRRLAGRVGQVITEGTIHAGGRKQWVRMGRRGWSCGGIVVSWRRCHSSDHSAGGASGRKASGASQLDCGRPTARSEGYSTCRSVRREEKRRGRRRWATSWRVQKPWAGGLDASVCPTGLVTVGRNRLGGCGWMRARGSGRQAARARSPVVTDAARGRRADEGRSWRGRWRYAWIDNEALLRAPHVPQGGPTR